jgi:DNA polymerase-3 subunit beta
MVANLNSGNINLEAKEEHLKIEAPGFSAKVSGMNTSDFPAIPYSLDTKMAVSFPGNKFVESLSQVVFAASVDETRPILTGVLFLFGAGILTLVATDGYRLSQKKLKLENLSKEISSVGNIILPKTVLSEALRLFSGQDTIGFGYKKSDNQVLFGNGDLVLSSRVLEGDFPDFEKIIPKSENLKVLVDKEEFLRAVKLASVFARDSANIVKLVFSEDTLTISAESQNAGSQKTKVEAKVESASAKASAAKGDLMEIAFNYRFLEEFLHSVAGDDVEIKLSDPNAPGVFTDPTDSNFLHLIMPVKIQS